MKTSSLTLVMLALLLSGCAQSGRVVQSEMTRDGVRSQVLLSEYFESRVRLVDEGLLAHLIVTLGKERVPRGQRVDLSLSDRVFNDWIEEVDEIYFTNESDQPLVLEDIRLSYFNGHLKLSEQPVTIQPGSFWKTPAAVKATVLYRMPRKRTLELVVGGQPYVIEMPERRTPVSELPGAAGN